MSVCGGCIKGLPRPTALHSGRQHARGHGRAVPTCPRCQKRGADTNARQAERLSHGTSTRAPRKSSIESSVGRAGLPFAAILPPSMALLQPHQLSPLLARRR